MADIPEEDARTTVGEDARRIVHEALGATERAVTGTSGLSVRVVVLLLSLAVCAALAPIPFNLIGVGAAVLLSISAKGKR